MSFKNYFLYSLMIVLTASAMDKFINKPAIITPSLRLSKTVEYAANGCFTKDSDKLVVGSQAYKFLIFDTTNYNEPEEVAIESDPYALDTNPVDNSKLALLVGYKSAGIWDLSTKKQISQLPELLTAQTIKYSKDATQLLLNVNYEKSVLVNVEDNSIRNIGGDMVTMGCQFNPADNNIIALWTQPKNGESNITLWDVRTNTPMRTLTSKNLECMQFDNDGTRVVVGSPNSFEIIDAASGKLIKTLNIEGKPTRHSKKDDKKKAADYAQSIKFIPGTSIFIANLWEGYFDIVDLDIPDNYGTFRPIAQTPEPNKYDLTTFNIAPDGKTMDVTMTLRDTLQIWDISGLKEHLKEAFKTQQGVSVAGDFIAPPQAPSASHNTGCVVL